MSPAKGARKNLGLTINEVKADMHHSKKVSVCTIEILFLIVRNTWENSHLQRNTRVTQSIKQWGYTSVKQQNTEFTA